MKFEEIFKEEGVYAADGFPKGFALEVHKNVFSHEFQLYSLQFKNVDDDIPERIPIVVYNGFSKKDYSKISVVKQLFKK
jgi:hypothetical protein